MSKKSTKDQNQDEAGPELPADDKKYLPESSEGKVDASALDQNRAEDTDTPLNQDGPVTGSSELESDSISPDDLLEDVRRSLIEEEAHDKEDHPKWWKRIGKGSRKQVADQQETPRVVEEISLPGLDVDEPLEEIRHEVEPENELDPIDELIDILEEEEAFENKPVVEDTIPEEPEKVLSLEELKKQAFQPKPSDMQEENLTEVRSIALEGDEEVFVEVQSTRQDPLEERLSAVENALKPYQRYIYSGIAMLGLVMAVIAGLVLFNVYKQTVAAPTEEVVSNLPYPISVSLPGGWKFNLGKGSLNDGNWNPKGAEWLQGTEVCRWVSLPYSRQLEAVLRTLNPDDPISLGMSNNDILTYKVYSIEQMSPEDMQKLDSNSPCLLVLLAEPNAEKRWVLTALP